MEIVIRISKELYEKLMKMDSDTDCSTFNESALVAIVQQGTPLPKGHGDLIDKDHVIARLEAASKFFGGENADAFDERFSHGLREAAIKVAEEPTIIEADKESEVDE